MQRLLRRLLPKLGPIRWMRSVRALIGGVRLHPTAVVYGHPSQISIGRGCKIGKGVVLDAGNAGSIVLDSGTWIASDVLIETSTRVSVGRGTTIQRRISINGSVRIGHSCIFAPNVFVSSGTHPFRIVPALTIREQEELLGTAIRDLDRPVWIQDDCWLGTNVVVMPGVTIGKGSVVGANAVVTRDVQPYTVVAGAPARQISTRLNWNPPAAVLASEVRHWPYVLSGRLPASSKAFEAGIEVTPEVPLHVALSSSDVLHGVELTYRSNAPLRLLAGQYGCDVLPGSGSLLLPVAVADRKGRTLHLKVTLESQVKEAVLVVLSIAARHA